MPAITSNGCSQNELKADNAAGKKEWVMEKMMQAIKKIPTAQLPTKNSLMGVSTRRVSFLSCKDLETTPITTNLKH